MFCKNCQIECSEYLANRNKRKAFCSHKYFREWNRGKNHVDFEGGRWFEKSKGYWMLSLGNGKHRAEHIVLMEKRIGRALAPNEVVHHKDGDKTNNEDYNLVLMTKAEHTALHAKMSYLYQQEHYGKGTVNHHE